RLYFNRLASDGLIGMVFYAGPNVWLRLEGVAFDAATNRLSFSHRAQAGRPEAHFVAAAGGRNLSGTVILAESAGAVTLPWAAAKNPLFGVGSQEDVFLSFWTPEGAFARTIAKVKFGPEAPWHRVTVTTSADDRQVTLVDVKGPLQRITAKVEDDR